MEFGALSVKFRKKRIARVILVVVILSLVIVAFVGRNAYINFAESQRLALLKDYSDQLDQISSALHELKSSGTSLDQELDSIRFHVNLTVRPNEQLKTV